ncbi:transmembrane protein 164 isoform X2 [Eurosta solidaginis]
MDWSWAIAGVNDGLPRTTGPDCVNYMTNRRRWIESILLSLIFIYLIYWAAKRLDPVIVPPPKEINKPHSAIRLILMLSMTFIFGIEMGFKFANQNMIYVLNPCHIQTLVQIYLLAAKPSKFTIALFRIQMNNLNGPFLAFLFPEVECRTLHFEQAAYWIQHALLYIIPVYILNTGAYQIEDISDYNWVTIGVAIMLLYHFAFLSPISMYAGVNLSHMLCAAVADPFQGQNYRIAATIHETILCPILNKGTAFLFSQASAKNRKSNLQLPINSRNSSDRRASVNDNALSAQLQYAREHLSKSVPTTPPSLSPISKNSPISEISSAAEMAAAVAAGSGPVTVMRQLKRNSISIITYDNTKNKIIDNSTSKNAEYKMPATKID